MPSSVAAARAVARNLARTRREAQKLRSLEIRHAKLALVNAVFEEHGAALRLFRPGERNRIVRDAFQVDGEYWIDHYLPLRFQDGYARAMLFYRVGDHYLGWKAMQLGLVPSIQDEISSWRWNSETGTFDGPDIRRLMSHFYDLVRQGVYRDNRESRKQFFEQYQRNRRAAMVRAREEGVAAARASGKVNPLVFSGALQKSAYERAYAVARATNGEASVTIRIPMPATAKTPDGKGGFSYGNSPTVHKVLRSLPQQEVAAAAHRIGKLIGAGIAGANVKVRLPTEKRPGYARLSLNTVQRSTLRTVFNADTVRRGRAGTAASLPAQGGG